MYIFSFFNNLEEKIRLLYVNENIKKAILLKLKP